MQHAVKADAGEQQSDHRKENRQRGEQTFPHSVRLIDFKLRANATHAKLGTQTRDFVAKKLARHQWMAIGGAPQKMARRHFLRLATLTSYPERYIDLG